MAGDSAVQARRKLKMSFAGKDQILGAAEVFDTGIAGVTHFSLQRPQPGRVTGFLFHRFFENQELECDTLGIYPHERVTLRKFDQFLDTCRRAEFDFVLPREMNYRQSNRKAILLTIDDGYADNMRILPLLETHQAKAVVFISSANILSGQRFWSDALYIGAKRRKLPNNTRTRYLRKMKFYTFEKTSELLTKEFGSDILTPSGFLDRPLTQNELKQLATSHRIEIGVHGFDHAILAPRTDAFVQEQLGKGMDALEDIIGYRPSAVAYPNGAYSDNLIHACQALGLTTGITIEARNNSANDWQRPDRALCLGRFTFSGRRNTLRQLRSTQLPFSVMQTLYRQRRSKVED